MIQNPFGKVGTGALALVVIPLALGGISTARAQLIDAFGDTSLAEYTRSVVLEQSGTNAISFASPSGALQVTKDPDSGAEQVLFLRGDYSLGVGQVLRIDTAAPQIATYADFGIVVSALVDPPDAVWTSGTADARANYINVYVKGQFATIGYVGFDGTTNIGSSSGVTPVPSYANVTGLFINRPSLNTFNLGYTTAGGETVLRSFTIANTAIGTALGFYADLRATSTFGTLDNLRLEPIPEPSVAALFGFGILASILGLHGRKKRVEV